MASKKKSRKKAPSATKKTTKKTSTRRQAKSQAVSAELRSLRSPISKLRRQIEEAPTRYRAQQLRNQLRTYELLIDPQIRELEERRNKAIKKKQKPAQAQRFRERLPQPDKELIQELLARYPDLDAKGFKKQIQAINAELRALRNPIYKLRRQIEEAPTRYRAQQLRNQLRTYELLIAEQMSGLVEARNDFNTLLSQKDLLKAERKRLQQKIRAIDKKLEEAAEELNWPEVERQTFQRIRQEGLIDDIDRLLGKEIKGPDISQYRAEPTEDERGYIDDPANPYTIWDAIRKLDEDIGSGEWHYFIINGKRFAAGSMVEIQMEASNFWLTLKRRQPGTPRVLRSFNLKNATVRYKMYKE